MGYTDLHTHTVFCDGRNTPEEMVLSSIEKGLSTIGILAHSYVEFDKECCIEREREREFIGEIRRLREKYKKEINVLVGIEMDYYTTSHENDYDYRIGSVHYFKIGEEYFSLDISKPDFIKMVEERFAGDYLAVCERYYELLSDVVRKTGADIIAHFDLITKFNEGDKLFDTTAPRYIKAYRDAIDALIPYGKPFEINTGVISRGYRSAPYPAPEIIEYIKSKGGKFILSSDSHSKENIAYLFDEYKYLCE
ncbi:MAG: histidinol-phosphatase [Clostridia bacterium]|nr:histidinol-phosphatase [Clostridia bacterium]